MFILPFYSAGAIADYQMVTKNSATDELDIEGTIGNLWAADLVGIYAQKKWLGMQE